jgi:hypothetical protein
MNNSAITTTIGIKGEIPMTMLLQQAFEAAAKLPTEEQDLLASRILAEVAAEDDFDRTIAASGGKLSSLAAAALAEHRAGKTQRLDPEQL